jgi:hypothetical protein
MPGMAELSLTADEWLAELRSELAEDRYCEPILRILSDPEAVAPPPSASAEERKLWVRAKHYRLREGLLFLKNEASPASSREPPLSSPTDGDGMLRLCIPTSMTKRILHDEHDTPTGGHFGADRTYPLVRRFRVSGPYGQWQPTPHVTAQQRDFCGPKKSRLRPLGGSELSILRVN